MVRRPGRVIYEAVDGERFRPDEAAGRAFRERHGLGDRPFLLAGGAPEREKRHDWLLDALTPFRAHGPPLLVCGGGGVARAGPRPAAPPRPTPRVVGVPPAAQ